MSSSSLGLLTSGCGRQTLSEVFSSAWLHDRLVLQGLQLCNVFGAAVPSAVSFEHPSSESNGCGTADTASDIVSV